MRRIILTGLLLLMAIQPGFSQDPLFERQVFEFRPTRLGPNRTHFISPFLNFTAGIIDKEEHTNWISGSSQIGLRYKFKPSPYFNLGLETGIMSDNWLNPGSPHSGSDSTMTLTSRTIRMQELFENVFIRIKYGQKGNYLGNYFDLGGGLFHPLNTSLIERYISTSGGRSSVMVRRNKMADPFDTGINAFVRIGFDRLAFVINVAGWNDTRIYRMGMEVTPIRY